MPLLLAAANRHKVIVKLLFNIGKVNINFKDKHKWTLLLLAVVNKYKAIVKLLFNIGKINVDSKD